MPPHGVRIRLTGPVPLATRNSRRWPRTGTWSPRRWSIALLGILWLAVHSARVVAAILLTTFIGLIMTAGLGLLVTGRFNLISVAFIPLFVGLGIDFSIQFSVRFLAERHFHARAPQRALVAAGRGVGLPLALAAAAIGVGFFAFLPTELYRRRRARADCRPRHGHRLRADVTLLPALLALLRPRRRQDGEWAIARLAPVESLPGRHRRGRAGLGLAVAVAAAALLPFVRFDFNPLHLKSPKVESMATLADLPPIPTGRPTPSTSSRPRLAAAGPIARRLGALPEVSRVREPRELRAGRRQAEKLALIRAAAERLGPALGVPAAASPSNEAPSDAEIRQALAATAALLRQVAPARRLQRHGGAAPRRRA